MVGLLRAGGRTCKVILTHCYILKYGLLQLKNLSVTLTQLNIDLRISEIEYTG